MPFVYLTFGTASGQRRAGLSTFGIRAGSLAVRQARCPWCAGRFVT
ncbi:MAG: hypothetical protein ACLRWF_09925 [Ruthenibacterium sp.]